MDACHARVFVSNESTMTDESSKPPLHNLLKGTTDQASELNRRRFAPDGLERRLCPVLPLAACGGGDGSQTEAKPADPKSRFVHGLASGDPLSDRVMLWARVTPAGHQADIPVQWELASDTAFASIVARGESSATAARDFTVKVDAAGLKPATVYHFRFRAHGVTSGTARTRTLPTGSVAQVRLAVFSCANYPAGYFNVYADAARLATWTPRYTWATTSMNTRAAAMPRPRPRPWVVWLILPAKFLCAGRLPRAPCPAQERCRPAGPACRRALDCHLGRPQVRPATHLGAEPGITSPARVTSPCVRPPPCRPTTNGCPRAPRA